MTNLTTRIDINKAPFSRYGSSVSVTAESNTGPLNIVNTREIFGKDQALVMEFFHNGQSISHSTETTPAELKVRSFAGDAQLYIKGDDGIVIETTGPELIFRAINSSWGGRRPKPLPEMPFLPEHSTSTRKVVDIKNNTFAIFDVIEGKVVEHQDKLSISPEGGKAVIWLRFVKDIPSIEIPNVDIDSDIAATEAEWSAWLAKLPEVPAERRAEAEQAWHILWNNYVRAEGVLHYDGIYVNKDYMTGVWSWDHCFHALGVARGNFQSAIEQLIMPFELQNDEGKMPDVWKVPDVEFWGITKPPVHGWCLMRLMEIGEVDQSVLEFMYPKLVKWTEFWFTERDDDNDGVPNYTEDGCDSGMDNATVFDVKAKLETPDLSSYLVLQMKAMAVIARRLGDEDAAKGWDARSEKLLSDMYEHFWKNDRFVCTVSGTHEFDPEPTAHLPLMAIALGEHLDKDIFAKCVAELENRFMTDCGIASEDPKSSKYERDSYWRGPMWAPQVYLTLDGLRRGGRADLAKEIARRYCDTIKYQSGGNFENIDPTNGKGLRASGFSWTSAVNLLCMWEYLK